MIKEVIINDDQIKRKECLRDFERILTLISILRNIYSFLFIFTEFPKYLDDLGWIEHNRSEDSSYKHQKEH